MALQTYENDEDELSPSILKIPKWTAWACWALALIIAFIMLKRMDSRSLAFGFYMLDAFTFGLFGIFFYFIYVRLKLHRPSAMELKVISMLAGLAALAQCVLTVLNVHFGGDIISDVYNGVQIAVWGLIAIFFFFYWWRMHDYDMVNGFENDEE